MPVPDPRASSGDEDPEVLRGSALLAVRALPPEPLRDDVLALLAAPGDPFSRGRAPAHVTASVLLTDPAHRRTLLVLHARVGLWMQPGGHVEVGDGSLAGAAWREAREETGATDLRGTARLLGLHRHPAPCLPPGGGDHLDARLHAVVPADLVPVVSAESREVAWFPLEALPQGRVPDLDDLVAAALRPLAETGVSRR